MSIIKGQCLLSSEGQPLDAELLIQSGFWIIQYRDAAGHIQKLVWNELDVILQGNHRYAIKTAAFPVFTSDDPQLIRYVEKQTGIRRWIKSKPQLSFLLSAVTLALGVGLLVWLLVPWVAGQVIKRFPIEKEIALGKQMQESFMSDYTTDDSLTLLVQTYLDSLYIPGPYPLNVKVVTSDQANAFALPGGNMVVFSGILKKMNRHESLAALLGHEATHINHRHSLQSISRNLAWSATWMLLLGSTDGLVTGMATNLTGLKYSRSLEEDADRTAAAILQEKNIDLSGMIELMQALKAIDSSSISIEFLQTHPLTDSRIEMATKFKSAQKEIKEQPALSALFEQIKVRVK